jgi:hypothetical protein
MLHVHTLHAKQCFLQNDCENCMVLGCFPSGLKKVRFAGVSGKHLPGPRLADRQR